ncbi:hypothetical protein ACFLQN_01990 [Candidatus Aenigmatarchaeota archaeon]
MSIPYRASETLVSDGTGEHRPVRPGDAVCLLPPPEGEYACDSEESRAQRHHASMVRFLGREGPYEISWIGRWPCGRHSLYLKMEGREPGAHATEFMVPSSE